MLLLKKEKEETQQILELCSELLQQERRRVSILSCNSRCRQLSQSGPISLLPDVSVQTPARRGCLR